MSVFFCYKHSYRRNSKNYTKNHYYKRSPLDEHYIHFTRVLRIGILNSNTQKKNTVQQPPATTRNKTESRENGLEPFISALTVNFTLGIMKAKYTHIKSEVVLLTSRSMYGIALTTKLLTA